MSLSPPPVRDKLPISKDMAGNTTAEMSRAWIKWFTDIKDSVATVTSGVATAWASISKVGSNLTDIETRNHDDLQNLNTVTHTHLTFANASDLTDGGQSSLHYHDSDRARTNHTGVQADTTVTINNAQNSDWTTVNDALNVGLSTGVMGTGNLVTDHLNGTIDVATADVYLRATNSDTASLTAYKVAAANLSLTDGQNNYIYAQYNAGAPNYVATITERTDTNTNVLIAKVYRSGTSLHINNYAIVRDNDNLRRISLRFVQTEPFAWASGCMLSGVGTMNIAITAGSFWECTNNFITNAFNSSTGGTFTYVYQNGSGGWTEQTAQTQINNTQYDNGSGTLQTLTANRYAVAWVYQEVDNDVVVLYGQGDYTLIQANAALAPTTLPPRITAQGFLIGKIILQKNAATFLSVESAFVQDLSTTTVNDHEQLAGLLGGAVNDHYHLTGAQNTALTTGVQTSLHGHPASMINITSSGAVTDNITVQDEINHAWSAGSVMGFALTDNGNGTINLAAGEAMLRSSASEHASLISITVGATTNLALTDNATNYVYVNYNAGTPIVQVGLTINDFNCMDKCVLYVVAREGTTLYYADLNSQNIDFNRKHRRMLLECEDFRHVLGGCVIGSTTGLTISVTAGAFYYGLSRISHGAFDTSTGSTFNYYYRNGVGGWTKQTAQTNINNTQYDDGTGTLATLANNKFGVHYVYLIIDTPTVLAVQFGQANYNTVADAQAAAIPVAPPTMQGVGVLVGRVFLQKSGAGFILIESAFSQMFSGVTAAAHNSLAGLQGGAINEYYHLTSTQYSNLMAIDSVRAITTLRV